MATSLSLLVSVLVVSGKKPLWYDEVLTYRLVTDPSVSHMLAAMTAGAEAAPPLYHFIARGWMRVFGFDPLALRLLSWSGFTVAILVLARLLRRGFDRASAWFGLVAFACGSLTVVYQSAEIRFYGIFTAVVALAAAFAHRTMREERPSNGLLVAGAFVNGLLVLCHFFGFAYSGAMLAAVVAWDVLLRRIRPRVYFSILLGWLAYIPWVGPTRSQAAMGGAEGNWTPIPGLSDLLQAFAFATPLLPLIVVALVLIAPLTGLRAPRDRPVDLPRSNAGERQALLILAFALMAVIPAAFVFSRVAVSLFVERYLLPAGVGWAMVLAELHRRLQLESARPRSSRWAVAAIVGILLLFPVYHALSTPRAARPGTQIEATRIDGVPATQLPIVVESNLAFLPLVYYSPREGAPYLFVVDSQTAAAPGSIRGSGMETRAMAVFRRFGYYASRIRDTPEVVCGQSRFLVLDDAHHLWAEHRVFGDSAFVIRPVGHVSSIHDEYTLHLVERRSGRVPRDCG